MEPPAFKILANGQDITMKINDRLERLTVHDAPGIKSDTVTIELDNRDNAIMLPPTGAELTVWLGTGKNLTYKGEYQVTELEEPLEIDSLTIHATATKFKDSTIKAPKDRTFDDISFGDLVNTIAGEHNLTPVVSETLSAIVFAHIDQKAESDLNLLTRLGKQYDAIAKPVAGRLLVTPQGEGKTASGQVMPDIVIADPANSTGRVTITERSDYKSVIAQWFDEGKQKKRDVIAGEGEPSLTLKRQYASEKEAQDAANAELSKQQRGKKKLSLERPLTPNITAESRVTVINHKASANGLWLAESVDHVVEPGRVTVTSVQLITPNK